MTGTYTGHVAERSESCLGASPTTNLNVIPILSLGITDLKKAGLRKLVEVPQRSTTHQFDCCEIFWWQRLNLLIRVSIPTEYN